MTLRHPLFSIALVVTMAPAVVAQPNDGGLPGGPVTSERGRALVEGSGAEHEVQPGDTLGEIAAEYGVTVADLVEANGLASPDRIEVGQTLRIPASSEDRGTTVPASMPRHRERPSESGSERGGGLGLSDHLDPDADGEESTPAHPWGPRLAEEGRERVLENTRSHRESIERTGVGLFYGSNSSYKRLDPGERAEWRAEHAEPGTTPPHPRRASCIGWALINVGEAYRAVGRGDTWSRIRARVVAQDAKGTVLAEELLADGWRAVYFNPDSREASDGNEEHTYTAHRAKQGKPYYGIPVSDLVIDYRPAHGSPTEERTDGLEKLEQVPFWFGLAKGGMHTFVGHEATVNEFHWTAQPDREEAMEETPLADFAWLSGLIVVPPATWPE